MASKVLRFLLALALLFLMLYLGKWVAMLIPIGISESIWGLLILFTALALNIIKLSWIVPASRPLLRYMALFFIPICAGIIEQMDILTRHMNALVFANFLSTLLSLVVIGYLAQWLFNRDKRN